MAFVSESQRSQDFIGKSASGNLGPGEYYNEGLIHKQAMEAIYPKKTVPFNSNSERKGEYQSKDMAPGKLSNYELFLLQVLVLIN